MSKRVLVEACCGSIQEAIVAHACNVDRIEISCALGVGGLTPTTAVIDALTTLNTPFSVMIRSSESWLTPAQQEIDIMFADCSWIKKSAAESVVFGSLTPTKTIDIDLALRIQDKVQKPVTFHRIVDYTRNFEEALQALAQAKIKRVLTSGGAKSAQEGQIQLAKSINHYQNELEFIIGGGINAQNVVQLVQKTKASQVHFSMVKKTGLGYDGIPLTEPDRQKVEDIQNALRQVEN